MMPLTICSAAQALKKETATRHSDAELLLQPGLRAVNFQPCL